MSMDDFMNRQRQRDHRKKKARGVTSGGDFRRYNIRMDDGEKGEYWPMLDGNGKFVLEGHFGHSWKATQNYYACTEDLPDFHNLCVFCNIYEQELAMDWNARKIWMSYGQYFFLGVWDLNPWREETYLNQKKEEKIKHVIWEPRRPGQEAPEECILGGKRFFRMSKNAWAEFETYSDHLSQVCTCVEQTNDAEVSRIYIQGAECPTCGCLLYTETDLDEYDTNAKMMQEVFKVPHECLDEAKGGCWTTEKKENEEWFYPRPIRACINHMNGGKCEGATPLTPFDGPAIVTRTGQSAATKYGWVRNDKYSWSDWVKLQPPEEAVEQFKEGMSFAGKLRVESLEAQAKFFGDDYKFPFDKKARAYGQKR